MIKQSLIAAALVLGVTPALAQTSGTSSDDAGLTSDSQVGTQPPAPPSAEGASATWEMREQPNIEIPADALAASPALAEGRAIFDFGEHIDTSDDRGIVTPGKVQLAGTINVDPAEYTTDELVEMVANEES